MDQLAIAGIFIVLLIMIIFNKYAVESMIINLEYNFNMSITDRYKVFIRYLYVTTLTGLMLFLTCGRLFN
ncbi:hypothetical protein ASZ90_018218 [hydrocarbon metagenome]|uniref:Uncharacterized protein n=1 Tax=hydrocarbon metagenome TaxID=938273 RepID=A0A0W8E7C6_9ZZZZ